MPHRPGIGSIPTPYVIVTDDTGLAIPVVLPDGTEGILILERI